MTMGISWQPDDYLTGALGRLTQEHQDVLRECYFAAARLHRPRMPWGSHPAQ